jgi:hypothetical protein
MLHLIHTQEVLMAKLLTIASLLGILIGGLAWVDGRYAKCADLQTESIQRKALEKRVNLAEVGTVLNTKQARLWAYEDRYGKDSTAIQDPLSRQEMKQLQIDVPVLRNKLSDMEK